MYHTHHDADSPSYHLVPSASAGTKRRSAPDSSPSPDGHDDQPTPAKRSRVAHRVDATADAYDAALLDTATTKVSLPPIFSMLGDGTSSQPSASTRSPDSARLDDEYAQRRASGPPFPSHPRASQPHVPASWSASSNFTLAPYGASQDQPESLLPQSYPLPRLTSVSDSQLLSGSYGSYNASSYPPIVTPLANFPPISSSAYPLSPSVPSGPASNSKVPGYSDVNLDVFAPRRKSLPENSVKLESGSPHGSRNPADDRYSHNGYSRSGLPSSSSPAPGKHNDWSTFPSTGSGIIVPLPPPYNSQSGANGSPSSKSSPSSRNQPTVPSSDAVSAPPRRRGKLPKQVTETLRAWLMAHTEHPYPSEDEKRMLCRQTSLSMSQVSNWMINARRRILIPASKMQNGPAISSTGSRGSGAMMPTHHVRPHTSSLPSGYHGSDSHIPSYAPYSHPDLASTTHLTRRYSVPALPVSTSASMGTYSSGYGYGTSSSSLGGGYSTSSHLSMAAGAASGMGYSYPPTTSASSGSSYAYHTHAPAHGGQGAGYASEPPELTVNTAYSRRWTPSGSEASPLQQSQSQTERSPITPATAHGRQQSTASPSQSPGSTTRVDSGRPAGGSATTGGSSGHSAHSYARSDC